MAIWEGSTVITVVSSAMLLGDIISLYITNFEEPFGSELSYSKLIEKITLVTISMGDILYDVWLVGITIVISWIFGWQFLAVVAFYVFSLVSDFYEIYLTLFKYKRADGDKKENDQYI